MEEFKSYASPGVLSPDPQSQAAASSSSGPQVFDISDERQRGRSRARARSTAGTRAETNEPETAAPKKRGRPENPNSARQKALAKKAEAKSKY